ncbi:MAG: MerR family transcriptional regulator [Acidobacteriota bacterium]|nr:MerR family transcriptional regulator [Acidobacteriota bacterium]
MVPRQVHRRRYLRISAVAEQFEIHPQTLRLYEREGLIQPHRSAGNTRLYDDETIERLRTILTLTRDLGVNLAGVEVVLNMREQMESMKSQMDDLLESLKRELAAKRVGLERRYALEKFGGGPPTKT